MYSIYLICSEINDSKLYKIGYTRRPIEKRLKEIKTGNGAEIYLVDSYRTKWGSKLEAILKRKFSYCNISGEWFNLKDDDIISFTETCYEIDDNLNFIENNNTYYIDKTNGKI